MQRYTFPKSERLLKRGEFLKVYSRGKKRVGEYLIIYILNNQSTRKIGVSIPRKIGPAVKRNRAKRLIRETYRLNKNLLDSHIHLVVTAKPEIRGLGYKDIENDYIKILKS